MLQSKWSAWPDSNWRPPVPQTGALTRLRHTPTVADSVTQRVWPPGPRFDALVGLRHEMADCSCGQRAAGTMCLFLRPLYASIFGAVGRLVGS